MLETESPLMPRMPSTPRHVLPSGACDCHAHVFEPLATFPLQHPASYALPHAPAETYLQMLQTLGMARGLLVQPAPYGEDCSALINALAKDKNKLRGIGIANSTATEKSLAAMVEAGVRGLRFVEMRTPSGEQFAGSVGVDELKKIAPMMKALGLHAQLWTRCEDYVEMIPTLLPFGIPIVLDHMGAFNIELGIDDKAFQSLLQFLRDGLVWVKLSVCRVSKWPYADLRPFHDALIEANPAQLLWGSDWPYVRMAENSPDAAELLDLFFEWVDDAAIQQKILVDNPARLYGF